MNDTIHIQNAFEELSKQHAELVIAFHGFASFVSRYLTKGELFHPLALATEYERMAQLAGEQLACVGGDPAESNPHLQFLANAMRNLRQSPLTLVTEDLIP